MPRGVYDRSLTPEQRAAQKSGKKTSPAKKAAPAAKKASPKKASAVQKTASDASPSTGNAQASTSPRVHTHELDIGTKFAIIRENIATLGNTVQGLTSGKQTVIEYPVAPVVALLDSELKANIEVLSNLRREVFGLSEAEQAVETEKASAATAEETDAEEVEGAQAAPVPAQPYPAAPQGTVPMPPTPPVGFPAAQ